ncbi:hypothetical protein GIB67_039937 [Kingdonia uniflora]|uniref:Terpene synthase N-terminal domain-containing protein n=1 Tax=Kingdonia uniflora TaxID=39325 RepID=A0A7J7P3F4_9MAGN|nr:hypothetical protein GIB67_039937 [Kingdonia uniflora]
MINALQRLAINYHFEVEIGAILSSKYSRIKASGGLACVWDDTNLYNVSLCFCLLRQEGHHISVASWTITCRKFKKYLIEDVKGFKKLYEASQLGIEGESLLEEAAVFAPMNLDATPIHLGEDEARFIQNTLQNPCNNSLARLKLIHYIKNLESLCGKNVDIQELAKMDFNIVQSLHQRELFEAIEYVLCFILNVHYLY